MSKAIKCDACGVCFDPYAVKGEFASILEFTTCSSEQFKVQKYAYRQDHIDFCPSCTRTMMQLLQGTKLVEKTLLDSANNDLDAALKKEKMLNDFTKSKTAYDFMSRLFDRTDELWAGGGDRDGDSCFCQSEPPERKGIPKEDSKH